MFNSPVIDLVILLSFVYFIGSLILSAINEAIAGTFRLRQADLLKGLYKFFFDPEWKAFVKQKLLKSPHIQTLMKKKDRVPAYIPAQNFVDAILCIARTETPSKDIVPTKNASANSPTDKPSIDNIVDNLHPEVLPKDLKVVVNDIISRIPKNGEQIKRIKELESRLAEFYNNTMDRVTGWYKRRVRKILFAVGIVMAIFLNIDTIKIANDALKDPDKLSKAVDNISANLSKLDSLNNIVIKAASDTVTTFQPRAIGDSISKLTIIYEKTSGFSLGYKDLNDFNEQWGNHFWKKLLGILLTVFALQLGANYWFDLMTKAVNIRAAGKKPDEKPKETKTT